VTDEMVGYCGYSCHLCAARSDDPEVRRRLVDGWRTIFGHEHYTAENVRCDGCRSGGRVADRECRARPCAEERGVASCAACEEFPCDKMRHLMASREGLLIFCVRGKTALSEADYDLCARQFESMPNLVRALALAGRLPAWAGGADEGEDG
jgi:hypothetical protein